MLIISHLCVAQVGGNQPEGETSNNNFKKIVGNLKWTDSWETHWLWSVSGASEVENLNALISLQIKSINKWWKVILGHDLFLALQDN